MAKPKPSAWGKLSHGQAYIPWSKDIARAVAGLGLGENVGMVLWHIIETSWSPVVTKHRGEWPDPVPCVVSQSDLAADLGIDRQRVHEALTWLTGARIILKTEEGFWVNKNVEEWIHPRSEAPLVSGKKLAWAASARTRKDKSDPQPPSNGGTLQRNAQALQDCNGGTLQPVTPERDKCNVGTLQGVTLERDKAHYIERAAEDLRETLDEANSRAGARENLTVYPKPEATPHQTTNPPEEIEAVSRLADQLFPGVDFGIKVRQLEASLNMGILEAALRDARSAGKANWNYVRGIYDARIKDGRMARLTDPDQRSVLRKPSVSTRPLLSDYPGETAAQWMARQKNYIPMGGSPKKVAQ